MNLETDLVDKFASIFSVSDYRLVILPFRFFNVERIKGKKRATQQNIVSAIISVINRFFK